MTNLLLCATVAVTTYYTSKMYSSKSDAAELILYSLDFLMQNLLIKTAFAPDNLNFCCKILWMQYDVQWNSMLNKCK